MATDNGKDDFCFSCFGYQIYDQGNVNVWGLRCS